MTQIDKIIKKYKVDLDSFEVAKENYYKECHVQNIESIDPQYFFRRTSNNKAIGKSK